MTNPFLGFIGLCLFSTLHIIFFGGIFLPISTTIGYDCMPLHPPFFPKCAEMKLFLRCFSGEITSLLGSDISLVSYHFFYFFFFFFFTQFSVMTSLKFYLSLNPYDPWFSSTFPFSVLFEFLHVQSRQPHMYWHPDHLHQIFLPY